MNSQWFATTIAAAGLVASAAQAPAPATPVDIGPEPTPEEALQHARTWASRSKLGPGTNLAKVKVVGPVRWHTALTARWPEGKDGKFLEGWLITFEEKPNWGLKPYGHARRVEILVDRDKAVHWRTQMEWDERNREIRP